MMKMNLSASGEEKLRQVTCNSMKKGKGYFIIKIKVLMTPNFPVKKILPISQKWYIKKSHIFL